MSPSVDVIAARGAPPRAGGRWGGLVAAAAFAALVGAGVLASRGGAWKVTVLEGTRPCPSTSCYVEPGQTLRPGVADRWRVGLGGVGALELDGGSELTRLPGAGMPLRLDRGRVAVTTDAPPRLLRIETPAATVVDLGCAFALEVSADATSLVVREGRVALETPAGVAVVAGGSQAVATPGRRPSVPLRLDAPPALTAVVRAGHTDGILERARPEDLLTLWHVLQVVPERDRRRVLDRIVALEPAAAPLDTAEVLVLDPAALERLWQAVAPRASVRATP